MAINVVGWIENEVPMSVGAPGTNNEWIGLGIRRRAPQMSRDARETAQTMAVAFGSWQPRLVRSHRLETSRISGRAYT